jgi:colanic acid/amylovoran biosynthesis protein
LTAAQTKATGVVVVNQHGDNRGDEAAMRGMVGQLSSRLPGAQITVLHQFADPRSAVSLDVPVEYLALKLPIIEGIRLAVFAFLQFLRIPGDRVLGRRGRQIVDRYRSARLVVSAPGGPYFGDLYADHEIVHWFYVWLARIVGRPLFLYAPSVGPFRNVLLNPVRRRGFRWFDAIALRDGVSAEYLRAFMDSDFEFEVTADSALQDVTEDPGHFPDNGSVFGLAVAVRDPGPQLRSRYDSAVVSAIETVCSRQDTEVIFLPQLHGPRHRDQPYLESLASRVRGAKSVHVESSDGIDSRDHRRIIARADLVIAGRYHPAVFSVAAATPVLVIPYEHKSLGVARQSGIERWVIDYKDAREENLVPMIEEMIGKLDEIREGLRSHQGEIRRAALRTTDMAIAVAGDQ